MNVIHRISLEKRLSIGGGTETVASVEFRQGVVTSVAISDPDFMHYPKRVDPLYQEHQIRDAAHRITSAIRADVEDALRRLNTVVKKGERVLLEPRQ